MVVSLITVLRESALAHPLHSEFLEAIRSVNPPGKWKILVVDEHSQKLLGSVLKQFDILEENVTLIESISNYREPQPGFEAVYLIMPTNQNVDRVMRDFSPPNTQYAAAHLFFIEGLPEPLFERLAASPAEPYLKGLKDLFVNFSAVESQMFLTSSPEMFFTIYSPPKTENEFKMARDRLEESLRFQSKIITNILISLNEFPFIRYYTPNNHPPLGPLRPHTSTRPPPPKADAGRWRTNLARGADARAFEAVESEYVAKLLAFMVQSNLEEHKKADSAFGKVDSTRGRSTMIITDRSMDTLAPFLHEFTYQAMANDLLRIEDGTKYVYKFEAAANSFEDKTATLSDADTLWTTLRHKHMQEAINELEADFKKFLIENAVFQGEGTANLSDMREMLAGLPQFQEQREKFSLHLSMAQECMAIFERDKLPALANVEQNCATGVTAEGKSPKKLVEEMVPLLDSREVVNVNKVRLVALYIQHREGVPEEDKRRLYQHARLSISEQDAVNSLLHLGVRVTRAPTDKDQKKKIKQRPADDDYDLSRFKPLLTSIIRENVENKLNMEMFPYVKEQPSAYVAPATQQRMAAPQTASLRSAKPSWHRSPRPGQGPVDKIKQRLFVFIAGGMTYSEVREAYQLSQALDKDIYIGSTHMITPKQFVDDLKVLDLAGVGSKAMPNGIPEYPGQRPYQEFYDSKYYTQDGPRPQPKLAPPMQQKTKSAASSVRGASRPVPSETDSFQSGTGSVVSANGEKKKKWYKF
ncbi:ras opposite [Cylindrobasidium torrendii FP15055 ss-10]|uniref:Ras opposite n=1 Tax=Cylindrobasidium torrendii FP15055 ss-10 TaxID=1314674 RepID=A0A0D7BNX6_9AGAR|nr:ras opposite [Cylindrobasidium torrendii FP15055 ss-10]